MTNPIKRGESSGQVSTWANPNDSYTPLSQTSLLNPYGLTLRQTINTGTTSVIIPNGITWVYAIAVGSGSSNFFGFGGKAGEITWGWTLATSSCVVGAGVNGVAGTYEGGYTRYGHILARGGRANSPSEANYFGQPAGLSFGDNDPTNGGLGANGGTGGGGAAGTAQGGIGGNGISGGGGGYGNASTGTSVGGNGGSGLVGGSGGVGTGTTTGTRTGGNGGNGLNILTGAIITGGTGASQTGANGGGGGGAGVAGNGGNASAGTGGVGGLGGGAAGSGGAPLSGDGILYLFY